MTARRVSPWQQLPAGLRASIAGTWGSGVPAEATALYGRWWQLETWLRSLIYVELRARYGVEWHTKLPPTAEKRETKDRSHAYMTTPDAQARLAYLDTTPLFGLLEEHWDLFADSLIEKDVWKNRVVELLKIRHRIGHCRRPHVDDLSRLEQTLRDLDGGAFRALTAFNRQWEPERSLDDPLVKAWVRNEHTAAARLVEHADRQDEVRFNLLYSYRPWATRISEHTPITSNSGYLWHARWILAGGYFDLRAFWQDNRLESSRDLIIFVCSNSPTDLGISFAAVDDPAAIANAIGQCFDALLNNDSRGPVPRPAWDGWQQSHADLDPRILVGTSWTIVDDTTVPVTIFSA